MAQLKKSDPLIINIDGFGIAYVTPEVPPLYEIEGYKLPKEQQKWRRPIIPDDDQITSYTQEEKMSFIEREFRRRVFGFWFMNNGIPTYLTGSNYFYLTYWFIAADTEDGYPEHREAVKEWFYVMDICHKDPNCFGAIMGCQKRFGKSIDLETDIPTPSGWKKMKDIHVGSQVFGRDGKPTTVTFESEIQYQRTCYEITFSDNSKIVADADHRWLASNVSDRGYRATSGSTERTIREQVVTSQQIFDTIKTKGGTSNWSIENCKPVEYEKKIIPIPAYIFGLWLGDGSKDYPVLTSQDEELVTAWNKYGKSIGLTPKTRSITHSLLSNGKQNSFVKLIKNIGVYKNKHIPETYLQSSTKDRIALLQGLMDTDGTSAISKKRNAFSFCNKNKKLVDGVKELVSSLGIKSTLRAYYHKKEIDPTYYLTFLSYDIVPFRMKRKISNTNSLTIKNSPSKRRFIRSMKVIDSVPVKCIQVDNNDHTYLITKSFIPTHNTEICLSDLYNTATLLIKDALFGMNSLSGNEAKNNLFKSRLMRSHKRIPNWIKPYSNESSSRREITSELTFKGKPLGDGRYSEALNNVIDWRPTLVSAYQGKKPAYIFFDEPGSIEEISLTDWWTTVKQQLALGRNIKGKCFLPTTLESMDPKGAEEFQEIYYNSDINKRDANGRTQSGLYKYFKPHYKGREGFIDEYGFDLVDEAKKFRQNELDNADDKGKYKIKRQYPESEEEMFYIINDESQLNLQNIQDQLDYIKAQPTDTPLFQYGNIEWIDFIQDNPSGCVFIPDPPNTINKGKWCFQKKPNTPNMIVWKNGKMAPANGFDGSAGIVGVDPITGVKTFSDRKSDLAMFGWWFQDAMDANSDCPIFDYVGKTPNPYDGFEDVIKTLIYLGIPAHIERNKEALIAHIEMRGYENYMVKRPSFSISQDSENKKDDGFGTPNVGDGWRNTLFTSLKGITETKVGWQEIITDEGKIVKRMSRFYLVRTLEAKRNFKAYEKWTKYDLTVAEMYCVVMRHQYVIPKPSKREPVVLNFPKYRIRRNNK